MTVQIRLMGTLEVASGADRVVATDFRSRKSRQVFEMLAIAKGRVVTKDVLLDTLWRRKLPENPMSTVEVAVSLARSTLARLGHERIVATEPGGYRIDVAVADIDIVAFDDLVARAARRAEHDRIGPFREALGLVRGPLLEDEVAADWLHVHRDRYRREVEAAQLSLARVALAEGHPELAFRVAERAWMASDLVLEEAYEVGVVALANLGRTSEARALHAEALRRVTQEDGRPPRPELEAVAALLQPPARRRVAAASVTVDGSVLGSPPPIPFIGRTAELAAIDTAIDAAQAGESSMVRVLSPAGMGRSRLLTEVIERQDRRGAAMSTHILQCHPTDRDLPLLVAGRLLRSVAAAAGRKPPVLDGAPSALFGQFVALLDDLGPTVLVIDDLRFADPAAVALLLALAAPGGAADLCLVVAQRGVVADDDDSEPFIGNSRTIFLDPLTVDELASVGMEGSWPETGGCPWVLAVATVAARGGGVLTPVLRRSLVAPVEALGPSVVRSLTAASTLTRGFSSLEVAVVALMDADLVAADLARAGDAGVLRSVGDGRFEFAADLLRRVLLSTGHARR